MTGVDEAVLAELRAIRAEIHDLSERVAAAATREDLHDYVSADVFHAHEEAHRSFVAGWRAWAPFIVSGLALLWNVIGPHVAFR
jgi:hypothetical protein